MIERQKAEINEFINKFNDLDNFIKQYKEEQFEIKKVREAILKNQKQILDIEKRIRELENQNRGSKISLDNFLNENQRLKTLIQSHYETIKKNQDLIDKLLQGIESDK